MGLNPYLPLSPSLSNEDYSFGVPNCLLDIAREVLEALLGDALMALAMKIQEGILWAQSKIAILINKFLGWLGIIEYDALTGKLKFVTDGVFGMDGFLGNFLGAIAGAIGALSAIADTIQQFTDEINALKACLEGFKDREEQLANGGGSNVDREPTLEERIALFQINAIVDWIERANNQLNVINEIMEARGDDLDAGVDLEDDDPIFRLTYGPPKSTEGQFLLSVDGLYFDSQNRQYADGNIPSIEDIGFVPDKSRWKLEHAPSLGGKGTLITVRDLNDYVDTLLDVEMVDDTLSMREHYDADHFLQQLEGQKAKVIKDIDSHKQQLIASGYAEDSAIYINSQQQVLSEIESFDVKIRKRKKQIELAVKSTDLFGSPTQFQPGEVPINDFSYLTDIHLKVALKKQRDMVVDHGEVSGVVLPLKAKFVDGENATNIVALAPIEVTKHGVGAMAQVTPVSSTIKPALTLNDPVATDHLVSIYNFINPSVVKPGSEEYNLTNCNNNPSENAQLVGRSVSQVFDKGLGLAKLEGIVRYGYDSDTSFPQVSSVGSYVKLKSSGRFEDLMYRKGGCSFDTWLHMPGLGTERNTFEKSGGLLSTAVLDVSSSAESAWTDFNYYKILLANENVGGSGYMDFSSVTLDYSTETVRGMVMGFTRDPIFTLSSGGIPGPDTDLGSTHGVLTGDTAASTVFFIAPTQSYSSSGASFIRKTECSPEDDQYFGHTVALDKTTDSGYKLSDCSSGFVHLSVVFDVGADKLKFFLNSELLDEALISEAFGVTEKHPVRVPTFKKDNSFQYDQTYTGMTGSFSGGPNNNLYFTPWIIGGGWTDGHPIDISTSSGGFMGNRYGLYSGLTGYVTSFKIYDKPLLKAEVLKNYNAHKEFLDNIEL